MLHYHRFLSTVFSVAVRWQIMPENPCARVAAPKVGYSETQFLDENGVAQLLTALEGAPTQFSVLVQLALLTGGRRGELCGLRWLDIDLTAGTLAVNRTAQWLPGQGTVFGPPKTNSSRRIIRLSADAVELLRGYRTAQAAEQLRLGSAWVRSVTMEGQTVKNDLLFTAWNGAPIDPNAVSTQFGLFLKKHGLPSVRFHSLRHTNATLLIASHVPVTTVSARLGHQKTSTTTDIYAGTIRLADAAAADALDAAFERIKVTRSSG